MKRTRLKTIELAKLVIGWRSVGWSSVLVFLVIAISSPMARAGEIEDLKALVEQQRRQLDELSKRIEGLEKATTPPAREAGPAHRDEPAHEASGNIIPMPPKPPAAAAPKDGGPGDLLANTVQKGDFPRSFLIPGSNISLRIAGYARFDAIYDDGALGSGVRYFPDSIGVKGTPGAIDSGVTRFSAGQTRINFEAQAPRDFGKLRAFVEADFFGSGDLFHLRHAYGEVGGFLAGYTYSTLMDLRSLPQTVAFTAPVGSMYRHQALIRYRHSIGGGVDLALAAENPSGDIVTAAGEHALRRVPDVVTTLAFAPSPAGHLQLGAVYRRPGFENAHGEAFYANAWGVTLSGHLATIGKDQLKGGAIVGDGVGSYVAGFASSPSTGFTLGGKNLETLKGKAGFLAYQHAWSDRFASTVMYGISRIDNQKAQPAASLHETESASANLIWNPSPGFAIGLEYLWGRRQNLDGHEGKNPRVQFGIQFGY